MKRKASLLIFLFSLLFFINTQARVKATAFRGVVNGGYSFLLSLPNGYSNSGTKQPLFLFLHGASLCGNNVEKVRRYGAIHAIEKGLDVPGIIVAPQAQGSWQPKKILAVLDYVMKKYNVDPERVYVFGMSLGGYGTMDFVGTYPDRVAAAMAICGGSTLKSFEGLSKLPFWIVHGTGDRAVSVTASRRVVNSIRSNYNSSMLLYSELPGVNHSQPSKLFYIHQTYKWLLSHTLSNRKVNKQFSITNATVRKPYEMGKKWTGSLFPTSGESVSADNIDNNEESNTNEEKLLTEAANTNNSDNSSTNKSIPETYTIKKGDNLYKIYRETGIPVQEIERINNISGNTVLRIGQVIKLKGDSSAAKEPQHSAPKTEIAESHHAETYATAESTDPQPTANTYIVQPGDNLYRISVKVGVTIEQLRELNNIGANNKIMPGQELKLKE